VGKQTCMIPRDLHHTPSMAAYKMIRLKFELACKSSITSFIQQLAIGKQNLLLQCQIGVSCSSLVQTTYSVHYTLWIS